MGQLPILVLLITYPNFGLGLFTKVKERNEFSSLSRNTPIFLVILKKEPIPNISNGPVLSFLGLN